MAYRNILLFCSLMSFIPCVNDGMSKNQSPYYNMRSDPRSSQNVVTYNSIAGNGTSKTNNDPLLDKSLKQLTSKILDTTTYVVHNSESSSIMLLGNYFVPFNNTTVIDYYLPNNVNIDMAIYNIQGRRVKTLYQGVQDEGTHSVTWDGNDDLMNSLGSGVYLCKLQCGKQVKVTKLFLLNRK